jgi:TetR/AcrR family transcriptional regulator
MPMNARLPTEERQADIVRATLALARDASPAFITTTDIARSIGLTQGALFKHFPTKDALWLATMRWIRGELLRRLGTAADGAAEPQEALRSVFRAHVAFVAEHPGVPRFIFHELQQPADSPLKSEVRGLMQDYRTLLMRLLGSAERRKGIEAGLDREAAATLFIGIVQGIVMQSMATGRPVGPGAQADRLFALYLRAVGDH